MSFQNLSLDLCVLLGDLCLLLDGTGHLRVEVIIDFKDLSPVLVSHVFELFAHLSRLHVHVLLCLLQQRRERATMDLVTREVLPVMQLLVSILVQSREKDLRLATCAKLAFLVTYLHH